MKFQKSIVYLLLVATVLIGAISCGEDKETAFAKAESQNMPLFHSIPADSSGVHFVNTLPETPEMNILTYQYLHNGGGVAIGDINNDGLPDIFFSANYGPNHLYLNQGNLKFKEIGKTAGVGGKRGWSTGVTMVDINSDGFMDIYVSRSGNFPEKQRANALFVNNGDLTFTEKAATYGLDDTGYSTQATFLDYDQDGDLDMFQVNHPIGHVDGIDFYEAVNGRNEQAGDRLYNNDNGHFKDVSEEAGIKGNSLGYGLSVSVGDLNNDGWPDIYVTNDYLERDYLYFNQQDGTFKENLKEATKHISNFSMGSDMADINNDGYIDIIVADMVAEDNYRSKTNMSGMNPERFHRAVDHGFHYQYMMNTLQLNNGNGTFSEIAQLAGVSNTDWSWAPLFADFDNDGFKDLMMTNGLRKEARNNDFVKKKKKLLEELNQNPDQRLEIMRKILDEMPEERVSNYIFKNTDGLTFENKTEDWGFNEVSFSNGAAYADLDADGDLDLVISNADHPAFLYENTSNQQNNYAQISLRGPKNNPSGIGATLTFKEDGHTYKYENYLNRGYQSSVEGIIHFGLGERSEIDSLWIDWGAGMRQLVQNISANERTVVQYDEKGTAFAKANSDPSPLFTEKDPKQLGISYVHKENDYDDFEKQVLLPHKMSTLGPALAVGDVNGDGLDDFFAGGAAGQTAELYLQKGDGTFSRDTVSFKIDAASEDVDALFFDVDLDNDLDLYVVSGGNEFEPDHPLYQDRIYTNDGKGGFKKSDSMLPKFRESGGTVAATDFDNDGDIDVFVGGRLTPHQYPMSPQSFLLENDNGVFSDVTETLLPALKNIGMIATSLWTDYNNDGLQDLLIAGEWTPLYLFENSGEGFKEVLHSAGVMSTEGWWYRIAQGDFDKDGDMDYVAGNLGLNYKYHASDEAPFELYYDDFDNNESPDIVLSFEEDGEKYPLRGRECSSQQLPFIKEKFGTYEEFAKANLNDILGEENLQNASKLQATNFASVLIENKGNGNWEISELPLMAQLSTVQDIVVSDYNNDGHLDLMIGGNNFQSEVETPRNDAGYGMILLGDGSLHFDPLSQKVSGLFIPNDTRRLSKMKTSNGFLTVALNNNGAPQVFTQ